VVHVVRLAVKIYIMDIQFSDIWVRVVGHGIFERLQEVLLELEVGQFFLLQEPHSKLSERIQREEANVRITMTADLAGISVILQPLIITELDVPG
jgi:hypothetical protein